MKPGDLVRMRDVDTGADEFIVGSLDMNSPGFYVPAFSVGIVVKIVVPAGNPDETILHVLVSGGRIGWIYTEDCEVFDEAG